MQAYVARLAATALQHLLKQFPAVALLGPRQCGKSTLARRLLAALPHSLYLDLERPSDLRQLHDPELFFEAHPQGLICLDEVQRQPQLFAPLRSILDETRRPGQLLMLGSASRALLRQSSESLAGRIAYLELTPLRLPELLLAGVAADACWRQLLLRGGYPNSYLATDDNASFTWRRQFIHTFLEHDLPQLGIQTPAPTMLRLWQMCAHTHGQTLNHSKLAASLGVSATSVRLYLNNLVQMFSLRLLPPLHSNLKKRLVKTPKIYIRDTGLLLSLLGVETFAQLLGHPAFGAVWEGFVVEQVLASLPETWTASFYRTSTGVELDLVLQRADQCLAIACKAAAAPQLGRGFYQALQDIAPQATYVVAPVRAAYPLARHITVTPLAQLLATLNNDN